MEGKGWRKMATVQAQIKDVAIGDGAKKNILKIREKQIINQSSFITIALFIDFYHLTGDVVTDAMSVSIQTCDIFSQAAYGVEPVLTEGIFYLYR
jgi:hypothetical protein